MQAFLSEFKQRFFSFATVQDFIAQNEILLTAISIKIMIWFENLMGKLAIQTHACVSLDINLGI